MHEVKVHKTDLLQKLESNRKAHIEAYEEAVTGYKKLAQERVGDALSALRAGEDVDLNFNLPKPKSYEKEYDRVIEMVKMSVETELELSAQEFAQFVMDDWGWKQTFAATTMMYTGR